MTEDGPATGASGNTEIRAFLDREAIREVIHRLARGADRHSEQLRRASFHDDAVDDHGLFAGSADEFVRWVMSDEAPPFLSTQHLIGNILIELDGDSARTESYLLATHVLEDEHGEYLVTMGGRYFDRLTRRDSEWRILERRVIIDWHHKSRSDPGCADFVDPGVFETGQRGPDDLTFREGFVTGDS